MFYLYIFKKFLFIVYIYYIYARYNTCLTVKKYKRVMNADLKFYVKKYLKKVKKEK